MSGLEQRAKPILLNMMSAARPGSVLTLGPGQAATVAAWARKTAWMREETAPGDRATTGQMRRALHRDALPPEYSKVWAARHAGRLDFDIKQAAIDAARHDRAWDTKDVRHVLWTCLTFRGISLLAYTGDGWGVPEPHPGLFRWGLLWPCASDVTFPPVTAVSDQDVLMAVVQQPSLKFPQGARFVIPQGHSNDGVTSKPGPAVRCPQPTSAPWGSSRFPWGLKSVSKVLATSLVAPKLPGHRNCQVAERE